MKLDLESPVFWYSLFIGFRSFFVRAIEILN
jgi:hypothetical protein